MGDGGIDGVVIIIGKNMKNAEMNGTTIKAQCGILLSRIANLAYENSLTGLEFASGIPGSLGGALYMNAGAYGEELCAVVKDVTFIDKDNNIKTIEAKNCDFGYRHSVFMENGAVITSCTLSLKEGNKEDIKAKTDDLKERRVSKQPLDKPSAGSTFKRPEGHFAGTLIEQAGLKGFSIGGAQVSEKHAGFVINTGNATAKDVLSLIEHIQKTVYEKFGVTLCPEVKMIGKF